MMHVYKFPTNSDTDTAQTEQLTQRLRQIIAQCIKILLIFHKNNNNSKSYRKHNVLNLLFMDKPTYNGKKMNILRQIISQEILTV